MMTTAKMQKAISLILLTGTGLAALLVTVGGTMLLWQHGGISLQTELLNQSQYHAGFKEIRHLLYNETSVALIEIGLLCLIMTQVARVALLACFYAMTRDTAYTLISLFILSILIYSAVMPAYA